MVQREIEDIVHNIHAAANVALAALSVEEANFKETAPLEVQKFDLNTMP